MRLFLLLPALLLSSCISHPESYAPKAKAISLPPRFDSSSHPVPEVATSLSNLFFSSDLKAFISRALQNNPDLMASAARLKESGFNLNRSRAGLFPSLSANTNGRRSQNNSAGAGFNAGTFITERYSTSLDAQWEIDVWGRIRTGVTAAEANKSAVAADLATARQSIATQTAQAYFSLVSATQLLNLTQRSLDSFKRTERLVNRRFETGLSSLGEISLAKTDVAQTMAQLAERKNTRDQAARRLASLAGAYPDNKYRVSTFPKLTRSIPAGLPSTLLRNRPDIDAAYHRIRAADANVSIVHSNLYPSFNLTASAGRQSSILQDLADSNFSVWSLAGNISAPLFAAGSLTAAIGEANAQAETAFANYKSTVLTALREVEDALGSEHYLAQQEQAAASAFKSAKTAEDRIRRNYESGLIGILTLLETQRRSFTTEESLIVTRTARYQNRVSLAASLGKAY